MSEVTIIGIDLAKRVLQLHGAPHDGSVAFRKKLSRGQLLAIVARHPKCVIAIEASEPHRLSGPLTGGFAGMQPPVSLVL